MTYTVKILEIRPVTHDVNNYMMEKPIGYTFVPGQATEVSINKGKWKDEKRPFTFTSLPDDKNLEFVIKSYKDHQGVTNQLSSLDIGDELILEDSWGAIEYKGKGVFIAGGAGITPFIAILKSLEAKGELDGNQLIFANKTKKDIILESYFRDVLDENFISVLDEEEVDGHEFGRIDEAFLEKHVNDFSQHFYVCGPDPMVKSINKIVEKLGASPESIVFEK